MDAKLNQEAEVVEAAPAVNATDETGPWHYRHASIRTYHVGEFKFENFLLTIPAGEHEAHQRWLQLHNSLPPREQLGITRYRAELLQSIDAPVPKPTTIVGVQKTSQISDLKVPSGAGVTAPAGK